MSKFRGIFGGKSKYVTVKPGAAKGRGKRELPDGLWVKCNGCAATLYTKELARHLNVCEKCGHHFKMRAGDRLQMLLDDPHTFEEYDPDLAPTNRLAFPGYEEKMAQDLADTGLRDAIVTGRGVVSGADVVLGVMEFAFRGGSMGSVVGEKVTRAFERATEERLPVLMFSASGGARMQESIFSLMQMQKTAAAVERHSRAGLLYISVMTDPTTAGVFGSFASLADLNIAEPGATIGFAGASIIQETIRRPVPPSLQKAETVLEHGFIDMIVPRPQLKATLGCLLHLHTDAQPWAQPQVPPAVAQKEA